MQYEGALDQARQVESTLAGGFASLRFPAPLERRFLKDSAAARLRLVQRAAFGAVAFYAGLLCADFFMVPDRLAVAVWLRLGVFFPLCMLGLYMITRVGNPRLVEWMVAFAGVMASAMSLAVVLGSSSAWAVPHLVVLNVIVVYATMIGRFWPMLWMCLLVAVMHVYGVATMGDLSSDIGLSTTLLLGSTIVFTLYGNYVLEHSDRQVYLRDIQEAALQAELAEANESLARTARTDPLTQVSNRRHFDEVLEQMWAQAMTQRSSVALMLLDIDHFKAYNDRYGHQAGDQCLCTVAQAIASCLRKSGDLLARWGGEEFAVVMGRASMEKAEAVAQRVRQAVQACGVPHGDCELSVVTVSIGVTAVEPLPETSLDNFLRTADAALYEAKSRGRNRVWSRAATPLAETSR